jgi:hypothetical protein
MGLSPNQRLELSVGMNPLHILTAVLGPIQTMWRTIGVPTTLNRPKTGRNFPWTSHCEAIKGWSDTCGGQNKRLGCYCWRVTVASQLGWCSHRPFRKQQKRKQKRAHATVFLDRRWIGTTHRFPSCSSWPVSKAIASYRNTSSSFGFSSVNILVWKVAASQSGAECL